MATIFTKIINGEVPARKVAEIEHHIAFLDIRPSAKGHTLVVPKQETDYLFDLSDDLLAETMTFAKEVVKAIDTALEPIRTGVIVEGMEVPHAHVHLIPIYREGQPFTLGTLVDLNDSELDEIAEKIRTAYNAS